MMLETKNSSCQNTIDQDVTDLPMKAWILITSWDRVFFEFSSAKLSDEWEIKSAFHTRNDFMRFYLKFSAVLGTTSAKSSNFIRPASVVPILTSKKTTGLLGCLSCDWIWLQEDIYTTCNYPSDKSSTKIN